MASGRLVDDEHRKPWCSHQGLQARLQCALQAGHVSVCAIQSTRASRWRRYSAQQGPR
jgi:hypothetical protein